MADRALNNSAPAMVQTGRKFGRQREFILQATFTSGAATLDTANSDDGMTIVQDSTGDYDVTFPKAVRVLSVHASLDQAADSPTAANVTMPQPRSFVASGTGKVLFFNTDDGALDDPQDDMRLYLTVKVGMR
jgi:hypothetical protein